MSPWSRIGLFFVAFAPQCAALCLADKFAKKPLAWRYNLIVALVCGVLIQGIILRAEIVFYILGFFGGCAGSLHYQAREWVKAGRPRTLPAQMRINWITLLLSGAVAAVAVHFLLKAWPK